MSAQSLHVGRRQARCRPYRLEEGLHLPAQGRSAFGVPGGFDMCDEHPQHPEQSGRDVGLAPGGLPQLVEGVGDVLVVVEAPGSHEYPALAVAEGRRWQRRGEQPAQKGAEPRRDLDRRDRVVDTGR